MWVCKWGQVWTQRTFLMNNNINQIHTSFNWESKWLNHLEYNFMVELIFFGYCFVYCVWMFKRTQLDYKYCGTWIFITWSILSHSYYKELFWWIFGWYANVISVDMCGCMRTCTCIEKKDSQNSRFFSLLNAFVLWILFQFHSICHKSNVMSESVCIIKKRLKGKHGKDHGERETKFKVMVKWAWVYHR